MLQRSLLFNLLLMLLITMGLLYIFFASLDWLTNHGKQRNVPALLGKKVAVACKELEALGFRYTIDSTYKEGKQPLEVLFQEPQTGTSVKIGRTIFLTINRQTPPSIGMPNLVNLSFRNAMLVLHSYNLEIGDTMYRPDVAAGSVLEQRMHGQVIVPGTLVPFGTRIDLVIGEGLSGDTDVPNLIGMTYADAKHLLDSLCLNMNPIWEGAITDTASAIIYMQMPEALNELDYRNVIPLGDVMDVRLQQSPSEELLKQNQPGSNKLIGDDDSLSGNPAVDNSSLNTHRVQHDSTNKHPFLRGMNAHNPTQKDDKEESKTEDKKKPASNVKQTNPQTPAPKTPAAKSSDHKGVQDNTLTNEYH